jgi:S-adenosylmethionine:tRNA ribosyltransferase-isomerase
LKTSDFYYHLPKEYIAQKPVTPRDSSRLLVYKRRTDEIIHTVFFEITEYLKKNDLLILNQTKVIQARLFGKKIPSGGEVELLLIRKQSDLIWQALVGGKGLKPGVQIEIENGPRTLILEDLGRSLRLIQFQDPVDELLDDIGNVPLPPYIKEHLSQPNRYQTVYAKHVGSAAAPTAGLHFTSDLLDTIRKKGVSIAEVTLHIGLDTFAPVNTEDPNDHAIHNEWCQLSIQTASDVNLTKAKGGRVITVGTTSVRTLETAARESKHSGRLKPFAGDTNLYILPGFQFQVVDCLLTNFHLPESTLLMMVSAFAGREKILELYQIAIKEGYRFYSFGDAMLIE